MSMYKTEIKEEKLEVLGTKMADKKSGEDVEGAEESPGKEGKPKCTECGATYTRKTTLRRHMAKAHQQIIAPQRPHVMHKCLHAECTEQFKHITIMLEHLKDKHGDTIDETQYEFDSMIDFKQWKEIEETQNYVFFAKCGAVVGGKHYYVCQRHGSQRPHRSKDEQARKTSRRNRRGSVKTNTICPARMNVKIAESGKVFVKYIYSHNHPVTLQDTEHQPIPTSVRDDIKTKLALGIKENEILKNLRDGVNDDENTLPTLLPIKRKYFVTKQQLRGIKRHKYGPKHLSKDDATSVTLKVTSLSKEEYNPVLLYKAKGHNVTTFHPDIDTIENSEDIFCLGLQTKEQGEMLKRHGEKLLCIDSIRTQDKYKYKLINLFIVDDKFNKSYPVGHLITTSLNRIILKNFFRELQRRSPTLHLSTVMTDDASACFNAVKEVFGEENLTQMLSRWHMGCVFRKQIRENTTDIENGELFTRLMRLQGETNVDEFTASMTQLIKQLDQKCPEFAKLLQSDYDSSRQWAMCYTDLPHVPCQGKTDVGYEMLSRSLREYYNQEESFQRIDALIDLLLTVDNDVHWRHKGQVEYGQRISDTQQQLSLHESGILFPDRIVTPVQPNRTWKIASSPEQFVTLIQEDCPVDFCEELCLDVRCAGLCQHMYLCTCVKDTAICEHQHKVHSLRQAPKETIQTQHEDDSQSENTQQADHHQTDHQSDHSIAGSDNADHQAADCHDDHQVRPDDQTTECFPVMIHTTEHYPTDSPHQTNNTQNEESVTSTSAKDYEVVVFQGAPSLGSTTQEETQQQVDGIFSQMEILSGHLENPRVRQLLLPHISESLNQLVSQCELLTNADVVEVTEQSDKPEEETQE